MTLAAAAIGGLLFGLVVAIMLRLVALELVTDILVSPPPDA